MDGRVKVIRTGKIQEGDRTDEGDDGALSFSLCNIAENSMQLSVNEYQVPREEQRGFFQTSLFLFYSRVQQM